VRSMFFLLTMKIRRSFLILLTAALPMLVAVAEDTGKPETTNQQTAIDGQSKTADAKDQMACDCDRAGANLDKLIAEMNSAGADKKLDAVAAAVNKLAEEFKASQQKSETKAANAQHSEMGMCKMMMGMDMKDCADDQAADHEHHH